MRSEWTRSETLGSQFLVSDQPLNLICHLTKPRAPWQFEKHWMSIRQIFTKVALVHSCSSDAGVSLQYGLSPDSPNIAMLLSTAGGGETHPRCADPPTIPTSEHPDQSARKEAHQSLSLPEIATRTHMQLPLTNVKATDVYSSVQIHPGGLHSHGAPDCDPHWLHVSPPSPWRAGKTGLLLVKHSFVYNVP